MNHAERLWVAALQGFYPEPHFGQDRCRVHVSQWVVDDRGGPYPSVETIERGQARPRTEVDARHGRARRQERQCGRDDQQGCCQRSDRRQRGPARIRGRPPREEPTGTAGNGQPPERARPRNRRRVQDERGCQRPQLPPWRPVLEERGRAIARVVDQQAVLRKGQRQGDADADPQQQMLTGPSGRAGRRRPKRRRYRYREQQQSRRQRPRRRRGAAPPEPV